ncbi:coiled-coil domain-containing protein 61-like isoform X2 [Limulus polyphemus]|nr:coiled-coil domain-containing protein 61-like isoform X2 [Limulus polyphemus]XP_022240197.1 coiled-coil domain-containing protein 61-like isoform X2 [Limulus polyphemus]
MLKTALKKTSSSVFIKVLTDSELEWMRKERSGYVRGSPLSKSSTTSKKRFLLLVYTVEFDRIHYPLRLQYQGIPDISTLMTTMVELRTALQRYKLGSCQKEPSELQYLREENVFLKGQIESLQKEIVKVKTELNQESNTKRRHSHASYQSPQVLHMTIKNLEQELVEEKSRHNSYQIRSQDEIKNLKNKVEILKAREKVLKTECQSLNEELNVLKKKIPSKKDIAFHKQYELKALRESRSLKLPQTEGRHLQYPTERTLSWSDPRRRRSKSEQTYVRSLSPSSAGSRNSRKDYHLHEGRFRVFDPTAYIQERDKKIRETDLQRRKQIRRALSAGRIGLDHYIPSLSSSRTSFGSNRSRSSSRERSSNLSIKTSDTQHKELPPSRVKTKSFQNEVELRGLQKFLKKRQRLHSF